MRGMKLAFVAVSLMAAMLWGCSSNRDSDGSSSTVSEEVAVVGLDVCVQCHDIKGQEWLGSRHGNPDTSPGSPHRPGESSCAPCHNPLNDGDLMQQAFNTHEPRRDVVGCESCHGGGGNHFGLGPIPRPAPEPEVCGECHNDIVAARSRHVSNGENLIFDKWMDSRHADSLHGEDHYPCQRCHTNEGALAANVAGYTGDLNALEDEQGELTRRAPVAIPEEEVGPVSCATCHDPHEAGQLREVFGWDPNENGSSRDQFDLCTSCHVLFNQDGELTGSGSEASGTAPFFHNTAWFRIIGTTHYDQPTDTDPCFDRAFAAIEGYNIRWNTENPCMDCHGHEFRTHTRPRDPGHPEASPTIWTEWASSGHAGKIFELKVDAAIEEGGEADARSEEVVDAVMFTAVGAETGDAWTHYNWDHPGRARCQQCHTATGVANWLDAQIEGEEYVAADNDFSHLDGWVAGEDCGSAQNEMLYCWGCHSRAGDGILRNPGMLTLDFTYLETSEQDPSGEAFPVVLPDKGNSNVCAACHSGLGNDTSMRESYADDSLSSRFAGHHAPTAGSLYAEVTHTGFEFAGQDYAPLGFFAHDEIGINGDDPESGSGPCASCHMGSTSDHTFEAVERNAEGEIETILNQDVCNSCHTGQFAMTPAILQEEKELFEATRALFIDYATNTMTNYKDLDITASANRNTATLSLNDYGAFQNTLYMNEEPCIYVHNRFYGKRIMFDSIDWLDNGVLNGTIMIDETVHPEAAAYLDADPDTNIAERP